jgi:osmotically-inducible protein OsmY
MMLPAALLLAGGLTACDQPSGRYEDQAGVRKRTDVGARDGYGNTGNLQANQQRADMNDKHDMNGMNRGIGMNGANRGTTGENRTGATTGNTATNQGGANDADGVDGARDREENPGQQVGLRTGAAADGSVSPLTQGNGAADLETTQIIRRALLEVDGLSMAAKNVTIITNDQVVTLKGSVETAADRDAVVAAANSAAGTNRIDDQIKVERG